MHFKEITLVSIVIYMIGNISAQNPGNVQLYRGTNSSGVVQIYQDDAWKTICRTNFSTQEAQVVCKQLGFQFGQLLPLTAYGLIPTTDASGVLYTCLTGSERLTECDSGQTIICGDITTLYASVSCFNEQSPITGTTVRLDNVGTGAEYFSTISVARENVWGKACGQFWTDTEANVACKQLSYTGGVASYQVTDWSMPVVHTFINCIGNETSLSDCPTRDDECLTDTIAAVVCYTSQAPLLSFFGGKQHYGKVVFSVDNTSGFLCDEGTWTYRETTAVCKTLGYYSGYLMTGETFASLGVTETVLDGLSCDSSAESIFYCGNNGWRNVSQSCTSNMAVSVFCYSEVRLYRINQRVTDLVFYGRPEFRDSEYSWYGVCATSFTKVSAHMLCREFGFTVAEISLPGNFGSRRSQNGYHSHVICPADAASLADCQIDFGNCPDKGPDVALVCHNNNTLHNAVTFAADTQYYGPISVSRYGADGAVCMVGWDDNDATVACRERGHHSGIALAGPNQFERITPLWVSGFSCTGTESRLQDCTYTTDLSNDTACVEKDVAAGVLCYLAEHTDQAKVRLKDGKSSTQGRAEVYNDVTGWSTICKDQWSIRDAEVFCRQAGYADGRVDNSGFTPINTATNPYVKVVLSGIDCEGTEESIFHCHSYGWLQVSSTCLSHTRDAGVYCYEYVDLYPSSTYGAVLYHSGDEYGLVCKDNFDENAAKVVCREMNPDFYFSKIICCNGFGPLKNYEFTMSDVSCDGSETSLRDCQSNTDTPSCPSEQYVSVVCNSYLIQLPYLNILQSQSVDPIVKVSYFGHDGYICSEDFTQADASVVCKELGYLYGQPYKASALGLETNLRWLRGMGCLGTEGTFTDCPNLEWGQIGVCSWDSVAAVMCSNNQADLTFDVRLANGSDVAGRLEVKVKGQWGTVCGRDLTKNVASVICRSLGYHDGITKAPGHYGAGAGDVIFSGLKCSGDETGFHECVWSGYNQGSSLCDHTQDAAIQCYLNMRLAGSTTVNYGRLEVFDDAVGDWSAVCDRNQHNYDATDICRQLDYVAGMFQSGSPLGNITIGIAYTTINCTDKTKRCVFTKGLCTTGRYVALYCSENVIPNESFDVRLPLSSFYGPVSVRRFGLWGHICSVTFDDNDAAVVCSQLGYNSGVAVHTLSTSGFPIIQGDVECTGTETSLEDCPRGLFADRHGCYSTIPQTVAAVLCYNEQLSYGSTPLNIKTGEMTTQVTISLDDQVLSVDLTQFTDIDATVYCRNLGYPGGQKHSFSIGNHGISDIQCTGVEESIIQCPGVWDPSKTTGGQGELAGVICRSAVNLKGGQSSSNGALYVSKGAYNGLVCHNDFDEIDAGVACRNLGYDNGLSLCCTPFGNIFDNAIMDNVKCTGSEKHFTDCPATFELESNNECEKDYAAVACYSGDLPATYSSISVSNSESHTGLVRLRYMGIDGLICTDDWTDIDAHVVCREMGLNSGIAYSEARSEEGPYWTSNVQCTGTETKLTNCPKTQLGKVTECTNQHHAAVICYDTEGVIYSLVGSDDPRYGFVQISINGEKGNICGSNWDSNDAQVLCKMLDFRAGDVGTYTGIIEPPGTGPVWDTNFRCEGTEQSLNHCVASGWRVSTNDTCARHQEDAGVFCYTSVKLSTGVGRETDQGAVLYYKDDKWHTICDEDFNDTSARVVCQELGFLDGKARCCSSFGDLHVFAYLMLDEKVMCTGTETDVTDCLVPGPCGSTHYASVVCYGFILEPDPVTMPPPVKEPFNATPVIVAIVLFLVLVLIAVALFFFVRKRRRQKKLEQSKLNFDNTIVTEQHGGNLMVQNPLHEIMRTPEVPRVHYTNSNGEGSTAINPGYQTSSEARGDNVIQGEIPGNNRTVINFNHYDNNEETNQNSQQNITGHHDYDNPNYVLPDNKGSHSGNTEQNVVPRESTGEHVYTSLSEQAELSSPTSESKEPKC